MTSHSNKSFSNLKSSPSDVRIAILEYMRKQSAPLTSSEIQAVFGITDKSIRSYLSRMLKSNEIHVVGHKYVNGGRANKFLYGPPPNKKSFFIATDIMEKWKDAAMRKITDLGYQPMK